MGSGTYRRLDLPSTHGGVERNPALASTKLLTMRRFATLGPRKALEEPLEVRPLNDEALARRSG